jgi:hypothetical protein
MKKIMVKDNISYSILNTYIKSSRVSQGVSQGVSHTIN